jgi:hypothetical protein
MFHPISLPDYSSMACPGCWPGSNQYASPHSTTQDPGFAGLTRSSTTSQLPPPTSSYEPIPHPCHSQSEDYYPADTAYSSCYQSPGQLASTLPENNPAFSDYSWLESLYALQPLQQEAQYPDTPFDVGCGSLTYPGTDCGQDACDSNNWVRVLCPPSDAIAKAIRLLGRFHCTARFILGCLLCLINYSSLIAKYVCHMYIFPVDYISALLFRPRANTAAKDSKYSERRMSLPSA